MRGGLLVLLLLTGVETARADPPSAPPAAKSALPPTPEHAADAALVSIKSNDAAALKALAAKDGPDPWLVADELIRRGEFDAADAFAKAASRADVEKLPAYVASRRGKPDDPAARKALAASNAALAAGKTDEALDAAQPSQSGESTVVAVRRAVARGLALRALHRLEESAAALGQAADRAEGLGWLAQMSVALNEAGKSAFARSDFRRARAHWERRLEACARRGDRAGEAGALGNIGAAYHSLGDYAKALEFYERALIAKEAVGDRVGAAHTLDNMGAVHNARGDFAKALEFHERALEAEQAIGDRAGMAGTLNNIGNVQDSLGNRAKALEFYERTLREAEQVGDRAAAASALCNLGRVHESLGDSQKALEFSMRALRELRALGDRAGAAVALSNIGNAHHSLGDDASALDFATQALNAQEGIGDRAAAARTLADIGNIQHSLGNFAKALESDERALKEMDAIGDRAGAARALHNMGLAQCSLGNFPRALEIQEGALKRALALGNRSGVGAALVSIGRIHQSLGNFAKALEFDERALEANEALGNQAGAALALANLGCVHQSLGNFAKALEVYERALRAFDSVGNRAGARTTLGNIGGVHHALGDFPKALEVYGRAREEMASAGDRAGAASTLGNIASVHVALGDQSKALKTYELALKELEALGDRAGAATVLGNIGCVHTKLGEHAEALAVYDRALKEDEAVGDVAGAALTLGNTGEVQLRLGNYREAVVALRAAVLRLPLLFAGLGDEEGATGRAGHSSIFGRGVRAAAATNDAEEAIFFLERGRAGSLLEALSARDALRSRLVPAPLLAAESEARAHESAAVKAYRKSLVSGSLVGISAAREQMEVGQAAVASAIDRIQRESKRTAGVLYPTFASLAAVRAALAPDDALVLYALTDASALALVVTAREARIAALPALTADIETACGAMLSAMADKTDVEAAEKAVDSLRNLAVKPLGLAPETKRVLVSPEGALSYVPFALLAPDREVVCVPSGTTYTVLLEDGKAHGDGVLALGDPDYESQVDEHATGIYLRAGAGPLGRLPATADEAKAVGGTALLGKDATEKGLRDVVATKPRWRAVHFACHGCIDTERPAFSSLALTSDGEDDGFLTVLEVFRSTIPADLVVLSACETGKGKIARGEGLMGLTRAFMFAGAPRVICSLWKVDDDATRALMVKFYELWNPKDGKPGLPTAEALRKAQEFVRTHEVEAPDAEASQRAGHRVTKRVRRWEHPYYWAAWVLWGLPS